MPTPCYFFAGLIERAGGVFVPVPIWDAEAIERAVTPRSKRARLDEPEQSGRPPSDESRDRRAARARGAPRPDRPDRRGVRALHPRRRARERLGRRAERDPGPQPRQEPRHARVADRLRRGRCGRDRRLPPRAGVGRDPRQPASPSGRRRLRSTARRTGSTRSRPAIAATGLPRTRPIADHPTLSAPLPSATPFLWLDLGGLPAQSLLTAGLAVVDGVHFGAPGYARLPFAGAAEHEAELRRRLALVEAAA